MSPENVTWWRISRISKKNRVIEYCLNHKISVSQSLADVALQDAEPTPGHGEVPVAEPEDIPF